MFTKSGRHEHAAKPVAATCAVMFATAFAAVVVSLSAEAQTPTGVAAEATESTGVASTTHCNEWLRTISVPR